MQHTVFKLGFDVFLFDILANIEAAAIGADKTLSPHIFFFLLFIIGVVSTDGCVDNEIAVIQLSCETFPFYTGDINDQLMAVLFSNNIGAHHSVGAVGIKG